MAKAGYNYTPPSSDRTLDLNGAKRLQTAHKASSYASTGRERSRTLRQSLQKANSLPVRLAMMPSPEETAP